MTSRTSSLKFMIMDACVLIDFIKADRSVLELIVKYVGPLHVASLVVDEVKEIDGEDELTALGLIIVEPEIEDAYTAGAQSGPLSFEDWLCMLTARRHGFTCVTNDKNLRKLCQQEKVPLLWGLELMLRLHKAGGITDKEAEELVKTIRRTNPRHITEKIVSNFIKHIKNKEGCKF